MAKTVGRGAVDLAVVLNEAEKKLHVLKEFKSDGGEFRMMVTADHSDEVVRSIIDEMSSKTSFKANILNALININTFEVEKARIALKEYMVSTEALPKASELGASK